MGDKKRERKTEEKSLGSLLSHRHGVGVLPYISYIAMCGPKGYGVSAVLVINRVSILAILVMNRVWFLLSSLEFEFCF